MTQKAIQKKLEYLGQNHGYVVSLRKKAPDKNAGVKKFLPDAIMKPYNSNNTRVFEVEKNVSNNTLFKSLASLLYYNSHNDSVAYLIVPGNKKTFAEGCLEAFKLIIRHHAKVVPGKHPKVRCEILTFEEVKKQAEKLERRLMAGGVGAPSKCDFLPRPG